MFRSRRRHSYKALTVRKQAYGIKCPVHYTVAVSIISFMGNILSVKLYHMGPSFDYHLNAVRHVFKRNTFKLQLVSDPVSLGEIPGLPGVVAFPDANLDFLVQIRRRCFLLLRINMQVQPEYFVRFEDQLVTYRFYCVSCHVPDDSRALECSGRHLSPL